MPKKTDNPGPRPLKQPPAKVASRLEAPPAGDIITEKNIEEVESQTIEKVNRTITVLEGSLATWDAAKEKPDDLADRFRKYKNMRDQLAEWETKILRSRMKNEALTLDRRLARLKEFIDICYANA
jgi:hypothetical protein